MRCREPSVNVAPEPTTPQPAAVHPLKVRNFQLLWVGSTISLFGDQFYFVAIPWLILQLTGSDLALGTIMMVGAIPRAVFMLLGGGLSDRLSPRRIVLWTSWARTALVGAIAAFVYFRVIRLWQVYFLVFGFGFADALSFPAGQALLPGLVADNQLPAANGLMGSSAQFSAIAGPAPAGLVLKLWGTAWAFLIDALSFLFVIAALVRLPESTPALAESQSRKGMWRSIAEGLHYVAHDPPLRSLMLLVAALNFGAAGPLVVGLATLAKQRFASAVAYGILLSCLAGGALLGSLLPALIKRQRRRGLVLLAFSGLVGVEMGALGLLYRLVPIALILATLGIGSGLVNVNLMAWFQARADRRMLGRVMSVLMFAAVGLIPFSLGLAGFLAQVNLTGMFLASGVLIGAMTVVAAFNSTVRAID
jgi:MFS transporter